MAGNGDEVLIRINGDNKGAVSAIRGASDELNRFGTSTQGVQFNLSSLGQQIFSSMGSFGAFALTANSVLGVIGELGNMVGGLVSGFTSLADTITNIVIGALQQAGQEIYNLTQQVFELNKGTEQSTGAWRFIFGGGGDKGAAVSQDLMNWTSSFSMQIPYTRQDLMGAITALGRAGLNEDQVKNYMSDIADMGALNPQRNLTQAAWSIQGAMHGYSRMLKYDYGINPSDLYKYGYDEGNPEQTLLPALRQYLMSRGLHGVSQWSATHTFWGAESSFIDRLQNFGLQVGGTNLNGTVDNGSMFGMMKQDLTNLSLWWDDPKHSAQIAKVADLLKNILGGAVKDLTAAFKGLATGLHASGLDTLLENILTGFGQWLNSPSTQTSLQQFGDAFGKLAGTGISTALNAGSQFFDALGRTGVPRELFNGLIDVFNNLTTFFNAHKQDINDFFFHLGTASGKTMEDIGNAFKHIGDALVRFKNSMTPQDWDNLKWLFSATVLGSIKSMELAFGGVADNIAKIVDLLSKMMQAIDWINQHTGGAGGGWFWNGGPSGGPGTPGGGGGGPDRKMSYMPGSYTSSSNTAIHVYGAGEASVRAMALKLLDERDRGSYLAKRTPGGFSSLGILG